MIDWKKFFQEKGSQRFQAGTEMFPHASFTVEEFYQAIKGRLEDEASCETGPRCWEIEPK